MRTIIAGLLIAAAATAALAEPDTHGVLLVNDRSAVASCAFLQQLHSKSLWGGFAATGMAYNKAMGSLQKKAAKLGATHLLLINTSNTMGGTNMIGDAYRCPSEPSSPQ